MKFLYDFRKAVIFGCWEWMGLSHLLRKRVSGTVLWKPQRSQNCTNQNKITLHAAPLKSKRFAIACFSSTGCPAQALGIMDLLPVRCWPPTKYLLCPMLCFSHFSIQSSVKHLYNACTVRYFSRCHTCHCDSWFRWSTGGLYIQDFASRFCFPLLWRCLPNAPREDSSSTAVTLLGFLPHKALYPLTQMSSAPRGYPDSSCRHWSKRKGTTCLKQGRKLQIMGYTVCYLL